MMSDSSDRSVTHADEAALPAFSPGALLWQLRVDAVIRIGAVAVTIAVFAAAFYFDTDGSALWLAAMILAVGAWVFLNRASAKAAVQLPEILALIEAHPAAAETRLAEQIHHRPLVRWVRLLLYQHLAMLRHRQRRFAEAAAIAQTLLAYPTHRAANYRVQLLLMLADSRLECRDALGAYFALAHLHHTPMMLIEHLQRVALQTHYEVIIGADHAALYSIEHKLDLAELLPGPQCGALHAVLAKAANRSGQVKLASWLWGRARLLCSDEQMRRLQEDGLVVAVDE